MTNNAEARAREVVAKIAALSIMPITDPLAAAHNGKHLIQAKSLARQASDAIAEIGNERAAQEREANAAIADRHWRGLRGVNPVGRAEVNEARIIAQEIRARGAA